MQINRETCVYSDIDNNRTIRIQPNDYPHYYILRAQGENIKISGKGTIISDKLNHTGTGDECGMGIDFREAINSSVKG